MYGYTVDIVLPMQPDEGLWSNVHIERVLRGARTNYRIIPSFESARRGIIAVLTSIRRDVEIAREIACDDAYRARALRTREDRFSSVQALRQYHVCQWRINQIDLLLQQVQTVTPPTRARHIAVAPSIRIAHGALAA